MTMQFSVIRVPKAKIACVESRPHSSTLTAAGAGLAHGALLLCCFFFAIISWRVDFALQILKEKLTRHLRSSRSAPRQCPWWRCAGVCCCKQKAAGWANHAGLDCPRWLPPHGESQQLRKNHAKAIVFAQGACQVGKGFISAARKDQNLGPGQ